MPSPRISKDWNFGCHFLTFTVKDWIYFFDRYGRWNLLAKSLEYCRENKGLKLFGFVFMINHLHLIVSCGDVAGFVRDFKKHTSKEFLKNIQATEPGYLSIFSDKNKKYQFWSKTNMPKVVSSEKFFLQKLTYIHENPVRKEYVLRPEEWYWSSANNDCELQADSYWE
jgi:REP element-mobilizing transposase RayT